MQKMSMNEAGQGCQTGLGEGTFFLNNFKPFLHNINFTFGN